MKKFTTYNTAEETKQLQLQQTASKEPTEKDFPSVENTSKELSSLDKKGKLTTVDQTMKRPVTLWRKNLERNQRKLHAIREQKKNLEEKVAQTDELLAALPGIKESLGSFKQQGIKAGLRNTKLSLMKAGYQTATFLPHTYRKAALKYKEGAEGRQNAYKKLFSPIEKDLRSLEDLEANLEDSASTLSRLEEYKGQSKAEMFSTAYDSMRHYFTTPVAEPSISFRVPPEANRQVLNYNLKDPSDADQEQLPPIDAKADVTRFEQWVRNKVRNGLKSTMERSFVKDALTIQKIHATYLVPHLELAASKDQVNYGHKETFERRTEISDYITNQAISFQTNPLDQTIRVIYGSGEELSFPYSITADGVMVDGHEGGIVDALYYHVHPEAKLDENNTEKEDQGTEELATGSAEVSEDVSSGDADETITTPSPSPLQSIINYNQRDKAKAVFLASLQQLDPAATEKEEDLFEDSYASYVFSAGDAELVLDYDKDGLHITDENGKHTDLEIKTRKVGDSVQAVAVHTVDGTEYDLSKKEDVQKLLSTVVLLTTTG